MAASPKSNRQPTKQPKPKPEQAVLAPIEVKPRSPGQRQLLEALRTSRLVLTAGPAGTGKTLLPISHYVDQLLDLRINKIVLTRPAVAAEEELGFLPGDADEKMAPYLRPLYDALLEKLGGGAAAVRQLRAWRTEGVVEVAPLGFMRGRTFKWSAILVDEAQNATYTQLKMALTRLGQGSVMCLGGDPEQTDLESHRSGWPEMLERIDGHGRYPVVRLVGGDVQRDPIVADLINVL